LSKLSKSSYGDDLLAPIRENDFLDKENSIKNLFGKKSIKLEFGVIKEFPELENTLNSDAKKRQ